MNTQNDILGMIATEAAEAITARPLQYRGMNACGEHLVSDCSPTVTHIFTTIEEAREFFGARTIRDLPKP